MSVAHFSPKYCKNWKHEWLAQAEENNIKYDMAVLGMWAWQTKKKKTLSLSKENPKSYFCRFF